MNIFMLPLTNNPLCGLVHPDLKVLGFLPVWSGLHGRC